MEIYDVMQTTFAAREFTGEPIPNAVLYRIIDNARFAPSGGNRQGTHIIVVRDPGARHRLAELNVPGARRYFAQAAAGESPWNPVSPTGVPSQTIAETDVPDEFTAPFRRAAVVLVVAVDLTCVAAMDQHLDRIGVVSGASVYPLVWNILLAARNEGYGGTLTTMAIAEEPSIRALLGIPNTYAVAALVPLGRPTRQPTKLRRRSVEEFTTWDRFDGPLFNPTTERPKPGSVQRERKTNMSAVPSRRARLAHAAKHAELWNAGRREEWLESWRTIAPGKVRMFDPVGTEEKLGFDAATADPFDMFQSILKITMITVQVNGNEMAWVCENHFGTEPNVQKAYSIETFAWDDDGNLLIKTYYPMPETVGSESDPYAHLLDGER